LLARYNALLARLEEVQGTLLLTNGIQLINDPCVQANLYLPSVGPRSSGLPAGSQPETIPAPAAVPGASGIELQGQPLESLAPMSRL
jgi:hypothetical protein